MKNINPFISFHAAHGRIVITAHSHGQTSRMIIESANTGAAHQCTQPGTCHILYASASTRDMIQDMDIQYEIRRFLAPYTGRNYS